MVISKILSGEDEIKKTISQSRGLLKAFNRLHDFDSPVVICLDSGQKITISKALEGGDNSENSLSVLISD